MKYGILKRALALALTLSVLLGAGLAESARLAGTTSGKEIDVTKYSYEVKPIYGSSTGYLYVRTENPDPMSFRLYDLESSYYSDGQSSAYWSQDEVLYADVRYENRKTYRVKGGYVFSLEGYGVPDGGSLAIYQRRQETDYYSNEPYYTYDDTGKTVSCPKLLSYTDGVIADFVKPGQSLFDALDAVESGLYKYAVYPRSVKDSETPSKDTPWPLLASSPYAELSLNEHYDTMYENHPGGMLLQNAYPYVLDSYSWPNTITAVARKLEPSCQVAYGEVHWQREITYNGETRIYGWAGEGTSDPIYSDQVEELYLFDGSSKDWFNPKAATTKACFDKLYSYNEIAKENKTKYADLIEGDTFVNTIAATGGIWIRVYVEGFLGGDRNFAYMLPMPRRNGCSPASDCWVDGRYISNKEIYVAGAKFSEHPTASIVAHDVQFTDDMGVTHKQDVRYDYDNATDSWIADYYAYNFNSEKNLPANLRLTRAQVKAMKPDANTMRFPTHCLIYDGSAKPGTPSDIVTVKLRITESSSFTLMDWAGVGEPYALPSASSFLGRTDDYPTGRQFKAWKVGSKLYEEGQTYTPKKDFEAVGTWKRFYAFMSDYYHVKAYVGSDETAKGRMYCAFYDAEGKLLATQFQELKAGETEYLFGDYDIYNAGAAQARLFMVDGNLIPLGDREIVEIK